MTTEQGEHLRDRITEEERIRLYALIGEHREIDIALNGLKAALKFEKEREIIEAYRENRDTTESGRISELKAEIRRTKEEWDNKLGVLADYVEDLGLLGVSL